MPKTFVFSTYGARGDVAPYLAIARELKRRGHRAIVAASGDYRSVAENLELEFRAVSPDAPTSEQARKIMHPVHGTEALFRDLLLPALPQSIAELREICLSADVLITHTTSLAGPIVAALEAPRGLKWVSSAVSPLALLGRDAAFPALPRAADFPALNRALLALLRRQLGMKLKETQRIRADLGVARGDNALWSDAHAPDFQLALWPDFFAPIAPGSPRIAVGFCFLDDETSLPTAIANFLDAGDVRGEAPLVFVAASFAGGAAWERDCEIAARKLGRRAILLGAGEVSVAGEVSGGKSPAILRAKFGDLAAIAPRAAALIHAGGIGTLALGLRAAAPMLLLPRAHDQFDNARRAAKLGIARAAPRRGDLAAQIRALLDDESLRNRLETARGEIENGAKNAAGQLEKWARRAGIKVAATPQTRRDAHARIRRFIDPGSKVYRLAPTSSNVRQRRACASLRVN